MQVIIDELSALREQFGDERRTEIVDDEGEIAVEELIADEDMVVTLSHAGYVKRNPLSRVPRAEARRPRRAPAPRPRTKTSSPSCSSPRRTTTC